MLQRVNSTRFDPNGAAEATECLFGLPFEAEECNLILIPVPWEATTSYARGTAAGPAAIRQASPQLDLFDAELATLGLARPWEFGIHLEEESAWLHKANRKACKLALPIIERGGRIEGSAKLQRSLERVNQLSAEVNHWVADRTRQWRSQGKLVGLVGGEHSTPFGAIQALAEEFPGLGVLQIDAHADLRQAYEGFEHSHASIMFNVAQHTQVQKIVQVGVRDFCDSEYAMATGDEKLCTYFDYQLKDRLFAGESWQSVCRDIVSQLPEHVYVSFDIDGLDPALCPHTGTPVPGGLSFPQATYLLKMLVLQGKKLVGFDLNEVAPGKRGDEWDGNVGARILYKLCGLTLLSAGAKDESSTPPGVLMTLA